MEKNEIANKAFEFVQENDEEGYQNFINSLSDDEHSLFVERMKEIETLLESVKRIK